MLEFLRVGLVLWDQLELLFFSGFDAQLQAFHLMLNLRQGCLDASCVAELHDGVHTLCTENRETSMVTNKERTKLAVYIAVSRPYLCPG